MSDLGEPPPRRRGWLTRRVVPTWVVILLALAAGALGVALVNSDDAESGQDTAFGAEGTSTTTEAPTTTTTTEPTTTTAEVPPDIAKAAIGTVFE